MLLQFAMFRGAKDYDSFKDACLEYAENQKVLSSRGATIFSEPMKSGRQLDNLCKQLENLTLLMTKQKQKPLQSKTVCYNCNEEGAYCKSLPEATQHNINMQLLPGSRSHDGSMLQKTARRRNEPSK